MLASLKKIKQRFNTHRDLPYILGQANADLPLLKKIEWVELLISWVRSKARVPHDFDTSTGQIHGVRIRFVLHLLERNPQWKQNVASVLRSLLLETSGLQLFCQTGLVQETGFISEGLDRLTKKLLPTAPHPTDLAELVSHIFPDEEDAVWIENLSPEIVEQIISLIRFQTVKNPFESLDRAIRDALRVLGASISALGLSREIRNRLPDLSVEDSPFLNLNLKLHQLMQDSHIVSADFVDMTLADINLCRKLVKDVLNHLETSGVSVNLVYRLEALTNSLNRTEELLRLFSNHSTLKQELLVTHFLSALIRESLANRRIRDLVKSNLHLLSRKIVERTGASGEHYITKTKHEYRSMLISAAGGGFVTVFTTIFKFVVAKAKLALFFEGLLYCINYSGSFVLMQLCGFTLATKQPSMTASALAGKLQSLKESADIDDFVNEVVRITRSQFAAALGNIGFVIPSAILVHLIAIFVFHTPVLSTEYAADVIASFHPFKSLTIPFAALTGVMLWLSSIVAGWVENWVVYRRIPEALKLNRRAIAMFGSKRCEKFSNWFLHNISGIAGSVSLGVFLGSTPIIGRFFGVPLDAKHVTLSTGALTFAVCSLWDSTLDQAGLAYACVGILFIGLLNFGVSFALALAVAARARNVPQSAIFYLLKCVAKKFRKSPLEFFYPMGQP